MPTTLTVDPAVRDRLKKFGTHGMTYNDILTRLMDNAEKTEFFDEIRRRLNESEPAGWVSLDDLDEELEPKVRAQRSGRASPRSAARKTRAPQRAARARGGSSE